MIPLLALPKTAAQSQPNDIRTTISPTIRVPQTTTPESVPVVVVQLKSTPKASGLHNRAAYTGRDYSKEEVKALIVDKSILFGINPEVPLCVAYAESGFQQYAKNKVSTASGVMQYIKSTWANTLEGKEGRNVFDAEANITAAVRYMATYRNINPWEVKPKCAHLKL